MKNVHMAVCPLMKCEDCVIKNNLELYYSTQSNGKPCKFYTDHPDGYAGGHIKRNGEMIQIANPTKCPRLHLFCTECPNSDDGKECKKFHALKKVFYG